MLPAKKTTDSPSTLYSNASVICKALHVGSSLRAGLSAGVTQIAEQQPMFNGKFTQCYSRDHKTTRWREKTQHATRNETSSLSAQASMAMRQADQMLECSVQPDTTTNPQLAYYCCCMSHACRLHDAAIITDHYTGTIYCYQLQQSFSFTRHYQMSQEIKHCLSYG